MKYLHLLSLQALPHEPVVMVSEFDDEGLENRRVNIWRSGRIAFAERERLLGDVKLGTYQFVSKDQFDDQPFLAAEISEEDFENHWALALKAQRQ